VTGTMDQILSEISSLYIYWETNSRWSLTNNIVHKPFRRQWCPKSPWLPI